MQESISNIKSALAQISDEKELKLEWLTDSRKGVQVALAKWRKQREQMKRLHLKLTNMLSYETKLWQVGYTLIAGIDEVGRGPLAGPVVSACVIMPKDDYILGINDSKQLSMAKREILYDQIMTKAISVGIGIVESNVIDELNIYQATKVAMLEAVQQMSIQPDYLLIDAMVLEHHLPQTSLIKGDANSYNIAAASIVAKVTRDRLMCDYANMYPHYDFEHNAGYGTAKHLAGLNDYGITPIHRKSFEPIKSMIKNKNFLKKTGNFLKM